MRRPHHAVGPFTKVALWIGICVIATASGCSCNKDDDSAKGLKVQGDERSAVAFRLVECPALKDARYENGREGGGNTMLEIVGGGVAAIDTDLDGCVDLFFPGGGHIDMGKREVRGAASTLFRGDGNWHFENITSLSFIDTSLIYSHGISGGDYDNDGFPDLLISGYQGIQLWKNQGDGTFLNVTDSVGLADAPWTTSAAWIDAGQDGILDLYLASYVEWDFDTHQVCPLNGVPDVCSPIAFKASRDAFYRGTENGIFMRHDEAFKAKNPGKGLGALAADIDQDRTMDLYLANDLTPNHLFVPSTPSAASKTPSAASKTPSAASKTPSAASETPSAASETPSAASETNSGDSPAGTFKNISFEAGCAVDDKGSMNASMGLALLDFNRDRQFDIVVSNFEHEDVALYQQERPRLFVHSSGVSGLSDANTGVVGFGIVAADFDGDADEDLMMTSGHVHYYPEHGEMGSLPLFFTNNSGKRWTRGRPSGSKYFATRAVGRGLAVADVDNDGDLDAIVSHLDSPPALLNNTMGQGNSWLRLRLIGTDSNRDAFGAVATVHFGDLTLVRQRYSGGSYLSQSQGELCWGWPSKKAVVLEVQWPNGMITRKMNVRSGQRLTLVEPRLAEHL